MDIKIFVCCHQPCAVPSHPLLVPLQAGAALADGHFAGFVHDDTGENISGRNRSYCELTGQYWAWKNVEADYYGFFHYRRYLYPDQTAKRPYRIEAGADLERLDKLRFSELEDLIPKHDLILPKGENMYVPVREHYACAPFHHGEDLELAEQILLERCPEYLDAADRYLSGTVCYFGNIFIMRRSVFLDYCQWLFPILEEFDRRRDVAGYGVQERRVDGYLAERLLGVYRAFHQENSALELPRAHFVPEPVERCGKRAMNLILPPGSLRRAWTKGRWSSWQCKAMK